MSTAFSKSFWQRVERWLGDQPHHACDDAHLLEQFVASRDEAAFQTLVERHGPMVWGVCRRVLRHSQDAEDAFQATFLILLMRAEGIHKRGSVGSWLYGVAVRTAQRARQQAKLRHARETAAGTDVTAPVVVAATESDSALEEELARLPEKYRLPLVLCYYQGQTLEHAAQSLGWPLGTVAGRMSRAREQLRRQLQRRGVALTAAAVATMLTERAAEALPPNLAEQTLHTCLAWLTPGKLVSAPVRSLAQGVIQAMSWSRVKLASVMVILLGLLTVSAGWLWSHAGQVLGADAGTTANPTDTKVSGEEMAQRPLKLVGRETTLRDREEMDGGIVASETGDNAPAELKGTVLLPDGKPAAGAKVWATSFSFDKTSRFEATTGADGTFQFTLPRTIRPLWYVAARLGPMGGEAGEAQDPYTVLTTAPDHTEYKVTIRLEERGMLRGKVVAEENGQPLESVKVCLDSGEVVVTANDGTFETGGLPLRAHRVIFLAPGRERRHILFDTTLRPEAELEVRLPQGGKVTGVVTDEEGKPLAGVTVQRYAAVNHMTRHAWVETTDTEGRFVYDGLALDRKESGFGVYKPGYEFTRSDDLHVRSGETPVMNFRLRRQGAKPVAVQDQPTAKRTLKGTVTKPDGTPAANALVRWGVLASPGNLTTYSNAQGKFTLVEIPDRKGRVTVLADDCAPGIYDVPAGDATVEIKLQPGQEARGVVRDHKGRPVAGVKILPHIYPPNSPYNEALWLYERATTTDAEGKFVLRGLSVKETNFAFRHPGLTTESSPVALKQGEASNNILMHPIGAVRGVVIDPDGKPMRNFCVRAGYRWTDVHFTSADGTFLLRDIYLNGPLTVIATAPGYGRALLTGVPVVPMMELAEGKPVVLQLTKPHALKVRVTTATPQGPKPVADAVIGFINDYVPLNGNFSWGFNDMSAVRHRTDAQGELALTNLMYPDATVIVEAPGYGRRYLIWREGERELNVNLEPAVVLTGLVQRENRPLSNYSLTLEGKDGRFTADVNATNRGRFTFEGLPSGEYKLQVHERYTVIRTQTVHLAAGEKKELPIELTPKERPPVYATDTKK